MMVELCTRKGEMGDEAENDVEDTSINENQRYDMPYFAGTTSYQ